MNSTIDQVYVHPLSEVQPFKFDEHVTSVFPDMIKRSVPGYAEIINTIAQWAGKIVQPASNIYDLGCSLGAVTIAIRRQVHFPDCQLIAVDNSAPMIAQAQHYINSFKADLPVSVLCDDIMNISIKNASLVVLNFTLQFISPENRLALIQKIYSGLKPGGGLILSEKLAFEDSHCHHLIDALHLDFKRANGYSELEISQKRNALENVMIPDTLKTHYERLKTSGFNHFSNWYENLNFTSMIAIK